MADREKNRGELTRSNQTPFSFMGRFMSDMDRMFRGNAVGGDTWSPEVDMFERGGQLVVHADLPGTKNEDVRVNVEDGVLTIAGEREHAHEHEKGGVYQCERSYGSFERRITLPEGVDPETIEARFDGGVLEVTMPAPKGRHEPRGRAIPIKH